MMFALQMYENAVALDPNFALAHAGLATVCAEYYWHFERNQAWLDRAIASTRIASAKGTEAPEVKLAEAWVDYAEGRYEMAVDTMRKALEIHPDLEGGYYLLGRALFESGRYQEIVDMMEEGPFPRRRKLQHGHADPQCSRGARQKGRNDELRSP
jgi:tetratricopeptide (TPR) repeat protein